MLVHDTDVTVKMSARMPLRARELRARVTGHHSAVLHVQHALAAHQHPHTSLGQKAHRRIQTCGPSLVGVCHKEKYFGLPEAIQSSVS